MDDVPRRGDERPTEDEIARARLGDRGVSGEPFPIKQMTLSVEKTRRRGVWIQVIRRNAAGCLMANVAIHPPVHLTIHPNEPIRTVEDAVKVITRHARDPEGRETQALLVPPEDRRSA